MQARFSPRPSVSVVIPAKNEAGAISGLLAEIAMTALAPAEIIVVDDGSTDGTAEQALGADVPRVRVVRHSQTAGQSRAIRTGIEAAKSEIVCTLDGDGQNDPAFLPALVARLLADPSLGLVTGQRERRKDTVSKRLQSRAANAIRRRVLRDATHDTGCGLKAMRRGAYKALPYFDHNHRFLPALFLREGWGVAHVNVVDRPRAAGRSKYGMIDRALVGLPDLIGVWWLLRRSAVRPDVAEYSARRELVAGE